MAVKGLLAGGLDNRGTSGEIAARADRIDLQGPLPVFSALAP